MISAIVILFTVGVISFSVYWLAEKSIATEVQKRVYCVQSERESRLNLWFDELYKSHSYLISNLEINLNANSGITISSKNSRQISEQLRNYKESYGSIVFCALTSVDGSVLAQSDSMLNNNNLSGLVVTQKALHEGYAIGPIHINSHDETVFNIGITIVRDNVKPAIFICQMYSKNTIEPILLDTTGLGRSGESFLIGTDTLMLTPSRFYSHPEPLTHKMPIPTALMALQGKRGVEVYQGFLGKEVVGAYSLIERTGWVLITEMVIDEAYEPLKTVARNTAIVSGLALTLMLYLSIILSRNWTRPMEQLAQASIKVAEGDLSVRMSENQRKDELGTLTRQFNNMVKAIEVSRHKLKISHNRLIQSEKMAAIGELVTGIVHEMRNPLSVIKMNLNLVKRKSSYSQDVDPVAAEQLELASLEADQLEKMLTELLDYSKPITLVRKNITLRKIVEKSLRTIEQPAKDANVEVVFKTPETSELGIFADETTLNVLMVNLILNAIQASEANSQVELSCNIRQENLFIKVMDVGIGMSEIVKARILDPFFTTREKGTGLGLSNVKKIVELYGGKISIESGEMKGTTFEIELTNILNHG